MACVDRVWFSRERSFLPLLFLFFWSARRYSPIFSSFRVPGPACPKFTGRVKATLEAADQFRRNERTVIYIFVVRWRPSLIFGPNGGRELRPKLRKRAAEELFVVGDSTHPSVGHVSRGIILSRAWPEWKQFQTLKRRPRGKNYYGEIQFS